MSELAAVVCLLVEVRGLLVDLGRRVEVIEARQPAPPEWLTADEVAAAFRVSRSWLYRSGVRRRRVGRRTLWHRAGLEDVVRGRA